MTTAGVLRLVLEFMAGVWLAVSAGILMERALYDHGARRLAGLARRLGKASGSDFDRLAADVSDTDFDQLVVDGLPAQVESALARSLISGGRREAEVQTALGSTGADVWERIRAARLLTSARADVAHQVLDQMLRSGNRELAAAALRFMVDLDDHRSAELLIQALLDGSHSPSRIAAAFNALSIERAETLAPLFASDQVSCRYWAARLAGFLGARRWTSRVRELTGDRDPFVRRVAVEALGVLGGAEDVPIVLELLSDPAPVVRAYAARAAAALPGADVTALRQLLNDSEWIVRRAAAEVLSARSLAGGGDTAAA